jgi:type II secretory pathway pseudopilin PulG
MKTNADKSSYSEVKDTCERERALTLTDLLVVLATLALLAVVILPALAKSGDNDMRMVCLNNLRQLGTALNLYLTDDQDYLPWPNWGCQGDDPPGWLYLHDCNTPNPLDSPITVPAWSTGRVANLKTSVYWQYLQNPDVYMCPVDAAVNVGTALWGMRNNKLSSYVMNGASCFFPGADGTFGNLYGYKTARASQIWSPLCIINWEPNPNRAFSFNDGAGYPDTVEGPSIAYHVTGGNVLAVGGNSRFMSFADLTAEMNHPLKNNNTMGKGLLWWNPLRLDGHGQAE